jgi:hypothetical protein
MYLTGFSYIILKCTNLKMCQGGIMELSEEIKLKSSVITLDKNKKIIPLHRNPCKHVALNMLCLSFLKVILSRNPKV